MFLELETPHSVVCQMVVVVVDRQEEVDRRISQETVNVGSLLDDECGEEEDKEGDSVRVM